MTPTQSTHAFRMACAMWLRDPATTLTAPQADWLRARLATSAPFSALERARLGPAISAWANALEARFGAVVAALVASSEEERHASTDPEKLRAYYLTLFANE